MEIRAFVTILVILFTILHSGEAIKCYRCTSQISKTCASEPASNEIVECSYGLNKCASCNYGLSNGTTITIRDCTNIVEQTQSIDTASCNMCNTDLCNNANMATISMAALGCLVSFWTIRSVLTNFY